MKTHWKQMTNPKYLGAYSLDGITDSLYLTISKVQREEIIGDGGKRDVKPVAYFKESEKIGVKIKPMVLNATNCKAITKVAASGLVENWAGVVVEVYILRGYIPKFGDKTPLDVLRIKPSAPKATKERMNKSHPKYGGMVSAIKAGKYSLDKLKNQFEVSPDTLSDIKKEVGNG